MNCQNIQNPRNASTLAKSSIAGILIQSHIPVSGGKYYSLHNFVNLDYVPALNIIVLLEK